MDRDERTAARSHEKSVAEEDVHFRFEQGGEQTGQIGCPFFQFGDDHFANAVGDVVALEKLFEQIRIADDDPGNRCLRRILDTQSQNDDARLREHLHHGHEGADAVGQENRILPHRGSLKFLGRFGRHRVTVT